MSCLLKQEVYIRQNMHSGITYLSAADLNTWHYLSLKKNDKRFQKGYRFCKNVLWMGSFITYLLYSFIKGKRVKEIQ